VSEETPKRMDADTAVAYVYGRGWDRGWNAAVEAIAKDLDYWSKEIDCRPCAALIRQKFLKEAGSEP